MLPWLGQIYSIHMVRIATYTLEMQGRSFLKKLYEMSVYSYFFKTITGLHQPEPSFSENINTDLNGLKLGIDWSFFKVPVCLSISSALIFYTWSTNNILGANFDPYISFKTCLQ